MDQLAQPIKKSKNSSRNVSFGKVIHWEATPTGVTGQSETGHFSLSIYRDEIIRVQVSRFDEFESNPYSVIQEAEDSDFSFEKFDTHLLLQTFKIKVKIHLDEFRLQFFDRNDQLINSDDPLAVSWIGTEVSAYKEVQEGERFLGLGEKTGNLDRSGRAYTNWNTDYFAYGVGDDPLYMSIPFYLGTHARGSYGIFMDNTHKSVFNFGASTNRFIYFSAEDGDMDYYFIHDDSVSQIISAYTWLTGRMQMPPKWALGFQQCRYSYYPDTEVYAVAQGFRDKKMPADVIYLDIHHMEAYKVFTFDGEKFSDPKAMISRLKEKGFKVVVIMDPGIKTQVGYLPYDEGLDQDLFVKYPDGKVYEAQVWPGWCAFPDFTKAETRSWWAEKMAFYTEAGVDGFWTDMNEPASWGQFTPNLIEFDYEGESASHRKARNIYGMQMARSAQEGSIAQNPDQRPFVLTRSGFAGIQRYAAAWTGDNVASEEHMLAGIRLVNSLGMSGVAFAGYDVGGFAGEASKGLFARWMSIGAFAPFYRAHSMINTNDSEPWAFGEEVEEISRNYMKLRYRLIPTIYSKFYDRSLNGLPIAESLAVQFSSDQKIYDSAYQNEYLFCDVFLVAPVESYKEITKVYLPQGEWYYLYSDEKHNGKSTIYQDCPINYLPVYVKAGSIFTQQSEVQNTEEQHDGLLRVHVYQGDEGSKYLHYEDAGDGFGYRSAEFFKRMIEFDPETGSLMFHQAEGGFTTAFSKIRIYFHGFVTDQVISDGKVLNLKRDDYAFIAKLTEFDPLPEHSHPYQQIDRLRYLDIDHQAEKITLSGLH